MKMLTAIVIGFSVFAYDIAFNNGEIVYWLASALGFN
jgi:hypothetical protein